MPTERKPNLLAYILAAPVVGFIMIPFLAYETWAAMTIWSWFSPWELPFTLVQGIGMNLAVSLCVRQGRHTSDDRTDETKILDGLMFYLVTPTLALAICAILRLFL